jgi:Lipase (class 3)
MSASDAIDEASTTAPTSLCSFDMDKKQVYASSLVPFTQSKLRLVTFAVKLSYLTEKGSVAELGTNARYITTGADAAVTFSTDTYCFVAFRGSINPFDVLDGISSVKNLYQDWIQQNFNTGLHYVSKYENGTNDAYQLPNEGCYVHEGFYAAYDGIGKDNIYNFVDTCMTSDSSTKKQLVLTGHSQGGAAAEIASIELSDFDPVVITFGSPPFLKFNDVKANCPLIDPDHIWRFVNTESSERGLQYDMVRR